MGKQTAISAAEQIARLMAQVESLSRDNERLARDNAELAKAASEAARATETLAEELRAELAAVKAERDRLIELVRLSNQRFFGCRSEKVVPDQLSLFNDMEAATDGSPEPAFGDAAPPAAPPPGRQAQGRLLQARAGRRPPRAARGVARMPRVRRRDGGVQGRGDVLPARGARPPGGRAPRARGLQVPFVLRRQRGGRGCPREHRAARPCPRRRSRARSPRRR